MVNHLVGSKDRRFGVIVNEFGETGIDGSLIENVDSDGIAELANGCLCCVGSREPLRASSRLVVIGRGLDPLEYQVGFQALKVR